MLDTLRGISNNIGKYIENLKKAFESTKPEFWLFIIIIFALALRLYFFTGINWCDDHQYSWDAYRVTKGEFYLGNYLPALRIGMIYPIAISYFLFDISEYSLVLYPLITSLASITLIFYLGKLLFDKSVALLAAFFLAIFPLDIIYATWALPDVPIAFFNALSVFLFIKAEIIEKRDLKFADKRKLLLLSSGLLIGISYLNKISGAFILLFLFPYIVYRTIKNRKLDFDYIFLFIGFGIILILEGYFYFLNKGDFFTRYNVESSYYSNFEKFANTDLLFYPSLMFNINKDLSFNLDPYFVEYGLFYYFIFFAIFYIVVKRKKEAYFPLIWFIILFLYLEFGTMSLYSYIPIHKLPRHLTVLTAPALLCLSYVFIDVVRNKKNLKIKKIAIVIIILFIFFSSIFYTSHTADYIDASTWDIKEMYVFTKNYPDKTFYCSDIGVLTILRFYHKFERNDYLRYLDPKMDISNLKDCFVIINTAGWSTEPPWVIKEKPNFSIYPQPDWKLVKTISGPKIGFYGLFDPEIYYVPESLEID